MTRPSWVGAFTAHETSAAWPAGHQTDDYALFGIEVATETPTTPTGCTLLGVATSGANTKLHVYAIRATSGAMPNLAIPGVAVNHAWGFGGVWRNVHATNPIHLLAFSQHQNALTTAFFPNGTIHHDDCHVVNMLGWVLDDASDIVSAPVNATLTNVTERYSGGTATGNGGGGAIITGDAPDAGTTGVQFDQTTCTVTSTAFACATIVLNPIADKTLAGTWEIDESPAPNGGNCRVLDTTQPAASSLCTVTTTGGGTGAFTLKAPYTDHDYQVVCENGSSYGASPVDQAV